MSYGLLTRRTDGTSIITPETFTVRVVDVFPVSLPMDAWSTRRKSSTPSRTILRDKVRVGMFATCTPSLSYAFEPLDVYYGRATYQMSTQGALIPKVTCGNGQVVLSPPVTSGKFGGDFYIHIYEYM